MKEVVNTLPEAQAEEDEEEQVSYYKKRAELQRKRSSKGKLGYKTREWVVSKKGRQRRQGRDVREDTKYTGRRRPGRGF